MSDEAVSPGEKGDPTYVSVRRSTVVLERVATPSPNELQDRTDDTSLSEDSISAINETMKRRKNPDRRTANKGKNKIVSTDSEMNNTLMAENNETEEKCYKAMSAPKLGACAHEALKKADEVNIKSKNIKGGLKEQLRDSIGDLKQIIHALIVKINAKGDVEYLRADTAKEMAKNIDMSIELEKVKRENRVLNIRLTERDAKIGNITCKCCTGIMDNGKDEHAVGRPEGRKRRRVQGNSPLTNSTFERDPDMEVDPTDELEDNIAAEIERYKEEARISHAETRRIVRDVRRLLVDTEMKEKQYENPEERKDTDEKTLALEEIYNLIGDFLNEDKPLKKKKPMISSVEKVKVPFTFNLQEHRPSAPKPTTS